MEGYLPQSTCAFFTPIWGTPRANTSLYRSFCFDFSSAASRFSALFSPKRSSFSSRPASRVYRSAGEDTSPSPTSCSKRAGPSPSMSMASRLAKWMRFRRSWAGHWGFVQRTAASPSSRDTCSPQEGHLSGSRKGTLSGGFSTTDTTSGIISPALRIITREPMRISFSAMKSWLWRVARLTVVPARVTGSKTPVGVSTPVRPTFTSMSVRVVSFSSGGYLKASAHRGNRAVLPSSSRWAKLSTLITAPSMGKASSPRLSPKSPINRRMSSMSVALWKMGHTGKPKASSRLRDCSWPERFSPCICWTLKTKMDSPRPAVTRGSFCRRDPAAALRGFLKSFSPKSSCRWHSLSKSPSERNTSPRTSIKGTGSVRRLGMLWIVRRFSVTSSPVTPSPRVEPRVNTPSTYSKATESPSNFGSTTYSTGPAVSRTRRSKSRSSSWEKAS